MSKPIIGLNADYLNAAGDKPAFTFVASGYYDAISKVGGIPVVIPPLGEDDDLEQLLNHVDGVVLIGGADLDPRRDGWMLHPTIRPLAERRELFDRRLIRIIADRRMPVFGIGAVLLACTELPLVIGDRNAPLPTLDTTRLLARAALARAVAGR